MLFVVFPLLLPLYIWGPWVASFTQREKLMPLLIIKTQGLKEHKEPSQCPGVPNPVNFTLTSESSKALAEFLLNLLN